MAPSAYDDFLKSRCSGQWKKIGIRKRAGILTPLFSIHSQKSIGVGEFPDLVLFADLCRKAGLSLIQLLPLNDVGFNFRPYDSESSFALEPLHLRLESIQSVRLEDFKKSIDGLRLRFPNQGFYFDTSIKKEKLLILRQMYQARQKRGDPKFSEFIRLNAFWLEPYACFKRLKEINAHKGWWEWPEAFKNREASVLEKFKKEESDEIRFFQWLQWQCFLQLSQAKKELGKKGVFLFGDLPFLVSLDSADVWANPEYFKLHLSAGAPPDLYFAGGQEWGMPPYDWTAIEKDGYRYLKEKLKYSENFYHLFRIDHFVGIFRVWTFPRHASPEEKKAGAAFDPPDIAVWEASGRKITSAMVQSSGMLPCAEDLGCVPECSPRVLKDFGIPGMDVQRWMRHWETTGDFKKPEEYRSNSIASISTHDMSPLVSWWNTEAAEESGEKKKFWEFLGLGGEFTDPVSAAWVEACLRKAGETRSIFSIQLLQDWMSLDRASGAEFESARINKPGIVDEMNWRLRSPLSLEDMMRSDLPKQILKINQGTGRVS